MGVVNDPNFAQNAVDGLKVFRFLAWKSYFNFFPETKTSPRYCRVWDQGIGIWSIKISASLVLALFPILIHVDFLAFGFMSILASSSEQILTITCRSLKIVPRATNRQHTLRNYNLQNECDIQCLRHAIYTKCCLHTLQIEKETICYLVVHHR